ncbi:MAG: hypothetical protein LUD17_11135 [Bacteroidales bacterium]|nr:hypothetical protein [Bacteroidales bacterium]
MKIDTRIVKIALVVLMVALCFAQGEAQEKNIAPWDTPEMIEAPLAHRLKVIEDFINSLYNEDENQFKLIEWDHQVELQVFGNQIENMTREYAPNQPMSES